jgi:hypothetical protein
MPKRRTDNTLESRAQFLAREHVAWEELVATWHNLSDNQMLLPGACANTWSIKDVMNHIAVWQEAAIHAIQTLEARGWSTLGMSVDRFNIRQHEVDRERSLAESLQRLINTRATLLHKLDEVTDEQLLNEYGRQQIGWWAKWSTYAHYEQHLPELRIFRMQQATSAQQE